MSYYAIFKPTQEAMDKLKEQDPLSYRNDNTSNLKKELEMELLILCMRGSSDSVRNVMFNITTKLHMLKDITIHECIQNACKQFEKEQELYWCGWDKARRYCDWTDKSTIDCVTENLMMHALIIPTMDYYSNDEHELFYQKWNDVKEQIEEFSESIYTWYIFEIMEQLVDYRIGEDLGKETWWKQPEASEEKEENDEH